MNVYLIRHETEISEFKNRYIYERIKMFVNRIVTGFRGFYRNFLVSTLWKPAEPQIYVIKGKILGDEGKAQTLYNLVLNSGANNVFAVVRYNGGPNRGGNLVTSGGNHLCLSQLNSAVSLGVMTVIAGDDALLDPGKIIHEADELAGILGKSREAILDNNTKIDGKTGLITNLHIMLNRMEEILNGHGTIGVGIYQAAQDKNNPNRLTFDDLFDENRLKAKVPQIVREKITAAMILIKSKTDGHLAKELKAEFELACGSYSEDPEQIDKLVTSLSENIILNLQSHSEHLRPCRLENGQSAWDFLKTGLKQKKKIFFECQGGDLFDPDYGFYPYVTGTPTRTSRTLELLEQYGLVKYGIKIFDIIRPYITKHGAGPLPTEIVAGSAVSYLHKLKDEVTAPWPAEFRVAWMDSVFLRYTMSLTGPLPDKFIRAWLRPWIKRPAVTEELVVTCLDRLAGFPQIQLGLNYHLREETTSHEFFVEEPPGTVTSIKNLPTKKGPERKSLTSALDNVTVHYQVFPGWSEAQLSDRHRYEDLPGNVLKYLETLSTISGQRIAYVAIGTDHSEFLENQK